jgi:UDP-N-acetylmuramyl pentapeptide phosphotransferase/UDP-N-acetylglucosamine-1-phosphate transferase
MTNFDLTALTLALSMAFMVSLLTTYTILPWVMQNMRRRGITGPDKNKLEEPVIPEMSQERLVII